jgi:hypothetical protein
MKIICDCCKKGRHDLSRRQSRLMTPYEVFMCNSCSEHEPRHLIILTAQMEPEKVKNIVVHRHYCGDDILLEELYK